MPTPIINGFTLIELIIVITIIGIIVAIAVPRLTEFKGMAEESVCTVNLKTVERMYTAFLIANDIEHTYSIFNKFITENFDEICPASGYVSYEDGKVKCSVHELGSEDEKDEVPWL